MHIKARTEGFIAALFITVKRSTQPNVHQLANGWTTCDIPTQYYLWKKEWNINASYNMGWPPRPVSSRFLSSSLYSPHDVCYLSFSSLPTLQSNISISKLGKEKDQHVTDVYPYKKIERHKGICFWFKKFTHKATHWGKKKKAKYIKMERTLKKTIINK